MCQSADFGRQTTSSALAGEEASITSLPCKGGGDVYEYRSIDEGSALRDARVSNQVELGPLTGPGPKLQTLH